MGRIKTFKGPGPNPNVPFVPIPDSRSVGVTERAVSNLASDIGKQATQYLEAQKKQTDTADITVASSEKTKLMSQIRAKSLGPDGLYDVDSVSKALNKIDEQASKSLSSSAFKAYNQRQTVLNANELARLQNENLKTTRLNNRNKFKNAFEERLSESASGSFEDMAIAAGTLREDVLAARGANIIDEKEMGYYVKDAFKKQAKMYLDNLSLPKSGSLGELRSNFEQAVLFIENDPYGIYGDKFLKESTLSTLRAKNLANTSRLRNQQFRMSQDRDKFIRSNQRNNFFQLKNKLNQLQSSGELTNERLSEIQQESRDLTDTGDLNDTQLNWINNYSSIRESQRNQGAASLALNSSSREEFEKNINRISDKSLRDKTVRAYTNIPTEFRGLVKSVVKYNKSSEPDVLLGLSETIKKFNDLSSQSGDMGYTTSDLKALLFQQNFYGTRNAGVYRTELRKYVTELQKQGLALGNAQDNFKYANKRLQDLLLFLNKGNSENN